jgi:DNA-binding winged helix-turn-helix (wHTH) protein
VRIAFDRFVLDLEQRRLLADELPVRLGPKAFDLLRLLWPGCCR